jgi:hypothetical protein
MGKFPKYRENLPQIGKNPPLDKENQPCMGKSYIITTTV